jgi:hypothetical protein
MREFLSQFGLTVRVTWRPAVVEDEIITTTPALILTVDDGDPMVVVEWEEEQDMAEPLFDVYEDRASVWYVTYADLDGTLVTVRSEDRGALWQ